MRFIGAPIVILGLVQGSAAAQAQAPLPVSMSEAANGIASDAACLVRKYRDADEVERELTIVVPSSDISLYAAKEFTAVPCGNLDLAAFRARACRLALQGNEAVQQRLEQVLGVSPAAICEAAKAVAPFPREEEVPSGG